MSIYRPDINTIFIHTPKTAGSSMEKLIGGAGHHPIWLYVTMVWRPDSIFKFGFVRNPYDRFVSAFFHRDNKGKTLANLYGYSTNKAGFTDFVRNIAIKSIGKNPKPSYPVLSGWDLHFHFLPQWFFLCVGGEIGVDYVGRFETLNDDWLTIAYETGLPIKLPHVRKSKHEPYQFYYLPDTMEIVYNIYKDDFKIFGYERED